MYGNMVCGFIIIKSKSTLEVVKPFSYTVAIMKEYKSINISVTVQYWNTPGSDHIHNIQCYWSNPQNHTSHLEKSSSCYQSPRSQTMCELFIFSQPNRPVPHSSPHNLLLYAHKYKNQPVQVIQYKSKPQYFNYFSPIKLSKQQYKSCIKVDRAAWGEVSLTAQQRKWMSPIQ